MHRSLSTQSVSNVQSSRRRVLQVGSATLAALSAPTWVMAQSSPKIRVGFWPVASGIPFFAAVEKGYFKEAGLDVDYLMLRGVFTAPGVPESAVKYYVDLFTKVRATAEWKEFMEQGAFNQTFMTGEGFQAWVAKEELRHQRLMKEAGFLAAGAR